MYGDGGFRKFGEIETNVRALLFTLIIAPPALTFSKPIVEKSYRHVKLQWLVALKALYYFFNPVKLGLLYLLRVCYQRPSCHV